MNRDPALSRVSVSPLLRLAIAVDGLVSALAGAAALFGVSLLAAGLGLPAGWTLGIALFMLGYGLALTLLARASQLPTALVWTLIIGNLLWVDASLLLAFSDWIQPQPWALTLLLGQALLVAGFSLLQFLGLRQARRSGPTLQPA